MSAPDKISNNIIDVESQGSEFVLISVIIPIFNGEKFLRECIESVKACPSQQIECIMINDGSTDGTKEICRQAAHGDARFRLIDKSNSGVSDSRNMGMEAASGDYIFFLDADDYIDTSRWPELLTRAEQREFDIIAYGYYDLFDSGSIKEEKFPDYCDIRTALLSTTLLNACWGKLLRRAVIEENKLRFRKDLRTCEDAVFILDFAQNSKNIKLSSSCVLYYRIHSGSVMHKTGLDSKLSDFSALYERRLVYLSQNYDELSKRAMYRQFFSVVTDLFRSCAFNRRIIDIRREYKKSLKNPIVEAIIHETKISFLTAVYKKLEYILMSCGLCTLLAVYYKLKGYLDHDK